MLTEWKLLLSHKNIISSSFYSWKAKHGQNLTFLIQLSAGLPKITILFYVEIVTDIKTLNSESKEIYIKIFLANHEYLFFNTNTCTM
jgi:hypothetical protein